MSADDRFQTYVTRPLPEILSDLVQEKASGILTAMGTEAHRGIVLVDGRIISARSTLEEEKLGLYLISQHWLDEKDRTQALLTQATADAPPLGEVLVARGFITASELEQVLQDMALTIIRRGVSDASAYAEFFEASGETHLPTLTQLSTTQILLNVARAFEDSDAKNRRLGDHSRRAQPAETLEVPLEDLEVTPTEGFILSRINRRPQIQDLIQGASLPEDQAIATIYTLVIAGLITIENDQPEASETQAESQDFEPPEEWSEIEINERLEIEGMAATANRTDHYQALRVQRTATTEEIVDAWNSIRQRFAASKTSEPHLHDAGPWLETIQERSKDAYHVLGDPSKRQRYDTVLAKVDKDRQRRSNEDFVPEVDPEARSALVEANLKRADELIRDGDIFGALRMLEQACAIDARPKALLKLAQLQLKNPKWNTKAMTTLQRALEVDPNFAEAWLELANFWHRRDDIERQRRALEKVLALDPNHPEATKSLSELTGKKPLSRLRNLMRFKKK